MTSMHPCKSYLAETNINTTTTMSISTQQQNLSRKRTIPRPKLCGWLPISHLTCILQWYILLQTFNEINASLQKLLSGNQYQHHNKSQIEKGSSLGKNFADDYQYLIWPVFYNDIPFCKHLMKSMHPFKTYWTENNISTLQQKVSRKRATSQPKLCEWLPIPNLTCILQWYKLLQTSNEINASLKS